jgi:hypothetical protein
LLKLARLKFRRIESLNFSQNGLIRSANAIIFLLHLRNYCCATVLPAKPAAPSVAFRNETVTFNRIVVGEVKDGRSQLSFSALVQVLGTPNRVETDNQTQRSTRDNNGIQLEATPRENAPFAILFQNAAPSADNQGIIPARRFEGTFDCLGIQLRFGEPMADRARVHSEARFKREADGAEHGLSHWHTGRYSFGFPPTDRSTPRWSAFDLIFTEFKPPYIVFLFHGIHY